MKKLLLLFAITICSITNAQYAMVTDFTGNVTGVDPHFDQNLISDGTYFYGMTCQGGLNNLGIVYKVLPDGTGYTKILDFDGITNGSLPLGSLIFDGTYLYGMTYQGGANGLGTAFKILPNGTGYTKLLDFAGATNGSSPFGSLIFDGTYLYGMTYLGGANDLGTAFKILPNGTSYTKLLDFAGVTNGSSPFGSLIFDGTYLYGMTGEGGANNFGTAFKMLPDGTGYAKLLDFAGNTNGSQPRGSFVFDGTYLYGMTVLGGANNLGTAFKILPNGTGYTKLLDFNGTTNGSNPFGSLIFDGTYLYGMTSQGGVIGLGSAFKILPNGTGYTKLIDFAGTTNGSSPMGSFILDGMYLYGMTSSDGVNSMGTSFKILPDGTGYYKLIDFSSISPGNSPYGSLIYDGTYLYGMTNNGGLNNLGAAFKIRPDGMGYTKILDFDGTTNGSHPRGSFIFDGTYLYGMTSVGGVNNLGTAFKILPNGTGYTKLLDFDGTINGKLPRGSFVYDGTYLYGMTLQGGANSLGTAFKILPNGTGYTKLIDFAGTANGSSPDGSFVFDGTYLYGMTTQGGASNLGTSFKILPNGTGYTKLLDFAGTTNGSYPKGSFIYDGTYLYGMTWLGGANNLGTAFKILPNGTGYIKLLDFDGVTTGSSPFGSLIYDGSYLYGMTNTGGVNNLGTAFKILPNGAGFTKLFDFDGTTNGSIPHGSLIFDSNYLYGMTGSGGSANVGTVFKYYNCTSVTASATSTNLCAGATTSITASGAISYTWSGGITNGLGFIPTSSNIYSVTGSGGSACANTATISITVNALPIVSIISTSSLICVGQSATLTANGANMYTWSSGALTSSNVVISPTVTTNYTVVGTNTLTGCSNQTTLTQSVSACMGIENLTQNSNLVNAYPNPTKGLIIIELNTNSKVYMTNALGQLIYKEALSAGKHNIDIQNQSNGIYFMKVLQQDKQQTIKLIKE